MRQETLCLYFRLMESLNDFLDLCKERTNARSDRNLGQKVGLSTNAICEMRKGRAFPSDDTVCHLATRANLDVDIALLWLNVWRAKGHTKKRYSSMVKKFSGVGLALVFATLLIPAQDANALIINDINTNMEVYQNISDYKLCAKSLKLLMVLKTANLR